MNISDLLLIYFVIFVLLWTLLSIVGNRIGKDDTVSIVMIMMVVSAIWPIAMLGSVVYLITTWAGRK